MEKEQTIGFAVWFDKYVAAFYGNDEFINENIKLKQDHSKRTCVEMQYLADQLNLTENQKNIAYVIALFHDLGRFPQFAKYGTYNDFRSTDHSKLALDVISRENLFKGVDKKEKNLIEKAIEYHSIKQLPEGLNGDCLLFSGLIRDADKIDIYYVVTEYYDRYRKDPDNFKLEIEFPNEPYYSFDILEDVLNGKKIENSRLKTWNDMKIFQLSWVYDINFKPTLERIKERKFLEIIVDFLPVDKNTEKLKKRICEYVDHRIEID